MERKSAWAWVVAGLVVLAVLPWLLGAYPTYIVALAGVYTVAAIGLNLLTGYAGQMSLGHAGFIAIGAYTSALLTIKLGWSFWLTLPAAGVVTGILGLILVIPALRLSGLYLAIATLEFGAAVPQLLVKWDALSGGYNGLKPPRPELFGWLFESDRALYYLVMAVTITMTWLALNLIKSRTGRALVAVRDSEIAAQAMGISMVRYKSIAFVVSSFYAGVAGSLYAHLVGFISPSDFSLVMSINLLSVIVIGGLASIPGSVRGALFLVLLPQALAGVKNLSSAVYGLALVAVVIFLPGGLWGWWLTARAAWAGRGAGRRAGTAAAAAGSAAGSGVRARESGGR